MFVVIIIIGAFFAFIGGIDLMLSVTGQSTTPDLLTGAIIFLLIGLGLIALGIWLGKRKKRRKALAQQKAVASSAIPRFGADIIPVTGETGAAAEESGISAEGFGLLIIRWEKKKMFNDVNTVLSVDGELVDVLSFTRDSKTVVPLPKGTHCLAAVFMRLRKVEVTVEIAESQCYDVEVKYSRAYGGISFSGITALGGVESGTMAWVEKSFNGRRKLIQAMIPYLNQRFIALKSITDTQAVLIQYSQALYWIYIFFCWGILPILAYLLLRNVIVKRIVLELQADGTVSTRVAKKADVLPRNATLPN